MPELAAFQRAFAADLLEPSAPAARPAGFAVYRNTVARGLIEALRAAYPTVLMLLGDARFNSLALAFIRRFPPRTPVLVAYGEKLADFIEEQAWAAELSYLPDIARLERLRLEAHLAADAEPLAPRDLAGIGPDQWLTLKLRLHPATRFAWFTSPALTIWQAHQAGEPEGEVDIAWRAEGVLFTRARGEVEAHPPDAPAHRLLFGLRLGESIGEAATAVLGAYPAADISRLFAWLLKCGALAAPSSTRT